MMAYNFFFYIILNGSFGMRSAVIEDVKTKVEVDSEVPIFDEDNWEFGKEQSSDKSIQSSVQTDRSIVHHINAEIKATKEGFTKAGQLKGGKPTSRGISLTKMNNPHHILKEGYMRKKTEGLFLKWIDRYVVLTPQKLIWFENKSKQKPIGCVNMRLLKTELKITEEGLLLDFQGECQNLLFSPNVQEQLQEWKQLLTGVLNFQEHNDKLMLKTANRFFYEHKDVLTERQFIREAETGDILLFYTENFSAKLQRIFTNSDFDHVAMVVKLKNKELMVFESNQMHGVSVYSWEQYIQFFDLYGKVTLRKLQYVRKPEAQASLLKFVKKNLGKKYEISVMKLLTFETDFNWETVNEDRGYFCSELIGKALKSIGLLDEKKSSGRYWPVDFAQGSGLQLLRGASLGPQQTIILNKHTKNKFK